MPENKESNPNQIIPKTIHYIWFGGNPLGEKELACIESWKKFCPDYEIVRWDESNFDVRANQYCSEAYDAKKWAFVSDYARLWVLVNHGGIYMDTDVEVVKPLDRFLIHEAFSGFESNCDILTGLMSCRCGFPLFADLLHDYDDRAFVRGDGSLDTTTNVTAITKACLKRGFVPNNKYQVIDGFALYPSDWFCPKDHDSGLMHLTENTHAIHHFAGSWLSPADQEIFDHKHRIMERHPGMSLKLAAAAANASYGFKHGDFKPLFDGIKRNVTGKQGEGK